MATVLTSVTLPEPNLAATPAVHTPDTVPVASALSMYDPVFIGIDENRQPVYTTFVYRNLLAGGEPGGGKSGLLNTICAHAAMAHDSRLVLFDAKQVELGLWRDCADKFVGPDITDAIGTLRRLQVVMDNRYGWLTARGRRKITPADGMRILVAIFDEIAYYSTVAGTKQEQEEFTSLLRDLVARGRACGVVVVGATQRPSWDIIPASLRDLFSYRAAFRCTTPNSSNIVLGQGWAELGHSAHTIAPENQGEALLIAEGGFPRRIKAAYLTDSDIHAIADYAAWTRRTSGLLVQD